MSGKYVLNPYLPEYEYIPDGEPHVFGNRVYIYGSHDRFGGDRFCMNDYVCYSADIHDLTDWRYEGVIYTRDRDPRLKGEPHELWAPDVVQGKDGRYYLYYCPDDSIRSIGVAVCDSPAGNYEFYGLVRDKEGGVIGEREGDTIAFDPGVFVDEDGAVYLYCGNGPRTVEAIGKEPKASVVMKLKEDMVTLETEPRKLLPVLGEAEGTGFEGHEFFEASSIRRIRTRYYLVYSSVKLHELCYAVSSRPDGGFAYGGVLVSNADISEGQGEEAAKAVWGNNHGGIECIDGEYYIFYHRQTNRTMYSRQGCAERLRIGEDGRIAQAMLTSCGLNQGPLPGHGRYPAACVCHLYGQKTPRISHPLALRMEHPFLTQDGPDYEAALPGTDVQGGVSGGVAVAGSEPMDEESMGTECPPRMYITNGQNGMRALFRYFNVQKLTKITAVLRGTASGILKVRLGEEGAEVGAIEVSPSEEWRKFSGEVEIPEGIRELCFCYEGSGALDFLEFYLEG